MATPLILYDNVLKGFPYPTHTKTPAAPQSGPFTCINLTDGRDFTMFKHSSGITDVIAHNITEAKTIDAWGVYTRKVAGNTATIALSYTRAGVTTVLDSVTNIQDLLTIRKFTAANLQAGDVVNITLSGGEAWVRQVYAGKYLEPPQGQYNSMSNPNQQQGYAIHTTISRTGDVLDRSIKRTERTGSLEISHVTESWYRTYWEPFAVHAQRRPFFYLPDPLVDSDAVFSTASAVVPGQPMGIGDLFSVKWKLSSIAKDSLYDL